MSQIHRKHRQLRILYSEDIFEDEMPEPGLPEPICIWEEKIKVNEDDSKSKSRKQLWFVAVSIFCLAAIVIAPSEQVRLAIGTILGAAAFYLR